MSVLFCKYPLSRFLNAALILESSHGSGNETTSVRTIIANCVVRIQCVPNNCSISDQYRTHLYYSKHKASREIDKFPLTRVHKLLGGFERARMDMQVRMTIEKNDSESIASHHTLKHLVELRCFSISISG